MSDSVKSDLTYKSPRSKRNSQIKPNSSMDGKNGIGVLHLPTVQSQSGESESYPSYGSDRESDVDSGLDDGRKS